MSKYLITFLVLCLHFSYCDMRLGACPPTCRCNGYPVSKCTSCYQPNKDILTNCIGCIAGYEYNLQAGRCLPLAEGACPSLCNCNGDAGVCSQCKDPNRNLTVNCAMCQQGFVYNFTEEQCYPLPCPSACFCDQEEIDKIKLKQDSTKKKDKGSNKADTRRNNRLLPQKDQRLSNTMSEPKQKIYKRYSGGLCLACREAYKDPANRCLTCIDGFKLNVTSGVCVSACPRGCQCSDDRKCDSCTDPNMDLQFSCRVCKQSFTYDEDKEQCVAYCPSGCQCEEPGVCARCKDPNLQFEKKCFACRPGYQYQEETATCKMHCPKECQCEGENGGLCTSCKDPNRELQSNCKKCSVGYKFQKNKLKPCVPSCKNEYCSCDLPGRCQECIDSHGDVEKFCEECLEGYFYDDDKGKCVKVAKRKEIETNGNETGKP